MDREKLRLLLRQQPFQPFRVHLTDGRTYDVQLPDMHILGEKYIAIGFPEPNVPDPAVDHSEIVFLSMISHVELLPTTAESAASAGS